MSKAFSHTGNTITCVAPYDVASGAGFQVGSIFAVAQFSAASGTQVEGDVVGVWDLAKSTSASTAITQGTLVYWDNTNKVVTKTAGSNKLIGVCVELDAADGDATVRVRLNGAFIS